MGVRGSWKEGCPITAQGIKKGGRSHPFPHFAPPLGSTDVSIAFLYTLFLLGSLMLVAGEGLWGQSSALAMLNGRD